MDSHLTWKTHINKHFIKKAEYYMFYYEKNISFAKHIYAEDCICCSFSHIDKIWYNTSTTKHKVFVIQKRVLRIMWGIGTRNSCRTRFKKFDILTVPSFYIFSFMMFVVNADNFSGLLPITLSKHEA